MLVYSSHRNSLGDDVLRRYAKPLGRFITAYAEIKAALPCRDLCVVNSAI